VHGLPHRLIAAKAKAYITYPTAYFCAGEIFLDPLGSLEKVDGIAAVFIDAGAYRKNIGVKDDVLCLAEMGRRDVRSCAWKGSGQKQTDFKND